MKAVCHFLVRSFQFLLVVAILMGSLTLIALVSVPILRVLWQLLMYLSNLR